MRVLEHAADLRAVGAMLRVAGVRVAQRRPGAVVAPGAGHLALVGEVAGRARGEQVVHAPAPEVGRRFAHEGRIGAREVRGVVPGRRGVVVGQVGADELAVHALEVVVGLAVGGVYDQVEVPTAHAQRPVAPEQRVRPSDRIRRGDRLELDAVPAHDLHPQDEPASVGAEEDVRTVHALARMQRVFGIVEHRRQDEAQVLPVVEVLRAVRAHAVVPDARAGQRLLLVFAVPVERVADRDDRAAVRLDTLAAGVQPDVAGTDAGVHGLLRPVRLRGGSAHPPPRPRQHRASPSTSPRSPSVRRRCAGARCACPG